MADLHAGPHPLVQPLKASLAAVTVLAASVAPPALAATHLEYESYSVTIAPQEVLNTLLGCTSGALVSGGYSLDPINDGERDLTAPVVVLNAPASTNDWGVGLLNPYATRLTVEFDISILCA